MDWIGAISTLGFPIVSAVAVAWFARDITLRNEQRAAEREAALACRIRELEASRDRLTEQVADDHAKLLHVATLVEQLTKKLPRE